MPRAELSLAAMATAMMTVSAPVGAQQPAAGDLREITVIGSRLPSPSNGLAQSVTVLEAREIQQFSPGRLEDILGQVAGIYVDSAGASGGFSSLYLRGGENSHLLVLVDGVKMNDPTTTRGSAYDLSAIDVNQIERIEILRGPASALHGGEALAGVINITTRRPSVPGFGGSAYAGTGQNSYDRMGATMSFGTGGVSGEFAAASTRDGADNGDGSLRLETFSGSLRLTHGPINGEVFARRTDRESSAFPDDSGGPRLAVNQQQTTRDARDTIFGAQFAADDWQSLRLHGGGTAYERKENADNAFVDQGMRFPIPAFASETSFRRSSAFLSASRDFSHSASLVAGIEFQMEKGSLTSIGDFLFDGNPQTLTFALERTTSSAFAEGRFQPVPPLSLQVGLRRDKIEELSETTSHLGLVWVMPNEATTLKAGYSEGFKPPSFFALGFPIGANPGLQPESSKNMELTLAQRIRNSSSSAQVSVFAIEYRNLIDFDGATFTNVNRGAIDVEGMEALLALGSGTRFRTQLGLTLLHISERDELAALRNRPERKLTASVVYDLTAHGSLFAILNDSSGFLDRSNPTGDIDMPGFTTVDAGYSHRFGGVSVNLSIDNMLDETYEQYVGFPARDRRLRVEVRGEFH